MAGRRRIGRSLNREEIFRLLEDSGPEESDPDPDSDQEEDHVSEVSDVPDIESASDQGDNSDSERADRTVADTNNDIQVVECK